MLPLLLAYASMLSAQYSWRDAPTAVRRWWSARSPRQVS